jgi:hypothetical protein
MVRASFCIPCFVSLLFSAGAAYAEGGGGLVNAGFEASKPDGSPQGWTVLTGLDPHKYGPPEYKHSFDAIKPVVADGGYRSAKSLAFPATGTWMCPVFTQSNGDGKQIDGRVLGKAAVYQTVQLPAGTYRFSAWLRTAEGHLYAAAFSLGVSRGPSVRYAHDDSTGIQWTARDLAWKRSHLRDVQVRGEWARYATEPFTLEESQPVTVWIRFNYANENQMQARWEVDNTAITRVAESSADAAQPMHQPCAPPSDTLRWQVFPGDLETGLIDAGRSSLVEAGKVRIFRQAREIPAGTAVRYEWTPDFPTRTVAITLTSSGECRLELPGGRIKSSGGTPDAPVTREWVVELSDEARRSKRVSFGTAGDAPARLFELEIASRPRTYTRLMRVEVDTVAVRWCTGYWDATSREYAGGSIRTEGVRPVSPLGPTGRWTLSFDHAPTSGHRYWLIHGLIGGTGRIDVGSDGLVDWVAESKGEEIVNFDVTELLREGENQVTLEAEGGEHDFAALIETCPRPLDPTSVQLAFAGDALAERLNRVMDNTWFWLRELHYEPSGFVDASVPRGHWFSQYWPVDIAFALREWDRWGHHDESVRIASLVSGRGWHGHESNRSGGADNTGGNILARELCEIIRRSGFDPKVRDALWPRVLDHCTEVVKSAAASPFGLIRGTNWENAGNRENGPCYALSTTLGAAASLRKAALTAEEGKMSAPTQQWIETAEKLRRSVLERLVLREDHRCPSGFVLPAGTWAYGLRPDGKIEDQPLAGYFWAGGSPADVDGLIAPDRELLAVYDRTLAAALPLFARGQQGVVSGYATSYDGPDSSLVLAALCDRIDALDPLLHQLARATDVERDQGSQFAELSRWAYGAPNDAEDTNLVCAATFLNALRVLAGVDDLLTEGRQLRLVPRLPWCWNGLSINGWRVRCRNGQEQAAWTDLWLQMRRDAASVKMELRTSAPVKGIDVRLGPFPHGTTALAATVDGATAASRREQSGDAVWAWVRCDAGPTPVIIEVRTDSR